uniref:Uncharacterized protein n=1 Tax=Cannabis sativa TaxID=3483 RepID=A0A803PVH8_CANSA
MTENNSSIVTQLAYELEVLRADYDNAEQKREEDINALAKANDRMKAIVKQMVTKSLDKALSHKNGMTKTKRECGDKYKDLHSTALTKIKNLEVDLKLPKLDIYEKDQKLTTLSQEYDK